MAKKEIYFWKYCKTCKNAALEEHKDPCNTCLSIPYGEDSHKPWYYEEDEK